MKSIQLFFCLIFLTLLHFSSYAQPTIPDFMNTDPVWSPDGTRILFISRRDGNYEIYVMDHDGSNQTRLSYTRWDESNPSWSPDGSKILFETEQFKLRQIHTMNPDGSDYRNITRTRTDELSAVWSPSGDKIAFESLRNGNMQIYLMNPDGSDQQRLTETSTNVSRPIWSADGDKLAFISADLIERIYDTRIYQFAADSSISYYDSSQQIHLWQWSPDGLKTLCSITESTPSLNKLYHAGPLADEPIPVSKRIFHLLDAKFSPDGSQIMYHADKAIYVMDIGKSKPVKVAKNMSSASWSPDSKKLVLVSYGEEMNIYTVNSDGSDLKQLTFSDIDS